MSVSEAASVQDYLRASFPDGDREYVDGRILERHAGEVEHADLQSKLYLCLATRYPRFWCAVEVRIQVQPARFRVPDVALVAGPKPQSRVLESPPHLVVEVLSREDRAAELYEKIEDYLQFGVSAVWVVNPFTEQAFIHSRAGIQEVKDGVLRVEDPLVEAPLAEVFGRER